MDNEQGNVGVAGEEPAGPMLQVLTADGSGLSANVPNAHEPNDLEVMSAMAKANNDIAFFPDVLNMKAVKKGAQVRVGITGEAMQKLARSYTETGPKYVGMFLLVNYEEFLQRRRELSERDSESDAPAPSP